MSDTIYALATAVGKAGVAVIRISGPNAFCAGESLYKKPCPPRIASLRKLFDSDGELIDEALVLTFPKGQSFTGEAVVELQTHGSPAVISSVLKNLSFQPNCRLADPGEFTRRALENDCLDLSQIEGLGDLLEAETEAQRRQAMRVMQGGLSDQVEIWRKQLIRAVALIEATIDFVDEDVPVDVTPEVFDLMDQVEHSLNCEIKGSYVAERVRNGFEVAIVGEPNTGKSTLLNRLAGREAALTSDFAGTTRDVIEVQFDLNGIPVTFLDTAGIRNTEDFVENLGIERALNRAQNADLRVFLINAEGDALPIEKHSDDIILISKADLSTQKFENRISGKTGFGVDKLLKDIEILFQKQVLSIQTAIKQRHRIEIENALVCLADARSLLGEGEESADLAAHMLHSAISSLNSLIGRVDVENILDEIFSSFCLGK